ncbi:hypothetical protein LCGC14_0589080 [marine sediment metagenome]|uniref:Uncharacterized protein n=1 Tax=marine sediment metagenome TaxID=412755 RepID=A0A0F9U073_9ZZZZ
MDEPEENLFSSLHDQRRLSAFNMAQLDLYRLHILLSDCNNLSRAGDLINWKRVLDALFRELSAHLTDTEADGCTDLVTGQLVPAMKDLGVLQAKFKGKTNKFVQAKMDAAYTYLSAYEISLRKVLKRLGISLPSRGVRSALGGGD